MVETAGYRMNSPETFIDVDALPTNPQEGSRPVAWWGTWLFIATEAMLFAALISSYFFLRFNAPEWPLGGIEAPELRLAGIGTVVLLASSGVAHWAERQIKKDSVAGLRWGLAATVVLGIGFLGIQAYEYMHASFTPQTNAYGSIFFGVTGFHGFHVLVGVVILGALLIATRKRDRYSSDNLLPVRLGIIYWHFVDVIWIVVFSSLYISEHL